MQVVLRRLWVLCFMFSFGAFAMAAFLWHLRCSRLIVGALVRSQDHWCNWGLEMPSLDRDGFLRSGYYGNACELHWRRRFSKWTDACGLYHPRVAITTLFLHPWRSVNLRGQSAEVLSPCELSFRNKGQISHAENGKNLVSARFVPLGRFAERFNWLGLGSDVWPDVSLRQPTVGFRAHHFSSHFFHFPLELVEFPAASVWLHETFSDPFHLGSQKPPQLCCKSQGWVWDIRSDKYILPNKQPPWNQKLTERKWPVTVCRCQVSCKRRSGCAQAGLVVGLATLPASLEAHNVTVYSVFGLLTESHVITHTHLLRTVIANLVVECMRRAKTPTINWQDAYIHKNI